MITNGHIRFFIIGMIIVMIGWAVLAVVFAPDISGAEQTQEAVTKETSITVETLPIDITEPVVTEAETETETELSTIAETDTEPVPVETEPIIEPVKAEEETELIYLGYYHLTAYCACISCCGKDDGITATGTQATQGRTIAVDPTIIPYGSKVVINGHTYIAEDCGGSIKGNRIDVYHDTHEAARIFGNQYADVYLCP